MADSNILVLAPHADDEVLGCGGMIAARAAAGAWVHVVVMGLGGVLHRSRPWVDTVDQRKAELDLAAERLGVAQTTVLYPHCDMILDTKPMLEIVTDLDAILDAVDYDEVYLPYASVNHDHQVVYRAALAALRLATGRTTPRMTAAYEYAMIGWQMDAVPGGRMYVDIESTLATKLDALGAYPSQLRPWPHPCSAEAVTTLARYRGMEAGLRAAELFYVLRLIEHTEPQRTQRKDGPEIEEVAGQLA